MTDAWTWVARYADGESVAELDPRGDHGFADVDLERVRAFEVCPVDPAANQASFCLLVDPDKGERPFFVRTRASAWLLAGGEVETLHTVLGLQRTVGESLLTVYVHFDGQGHVVIASERIL
jgi:hypothetical protein